MSPFEMEEKMEEKALLELIRTHIEDDRKIYQNNLSLLEKISDQTQKTRESIGELDKKLDLSIQKIEYQIRAINDLDKQQNELIDQHIAGVKTNTERLELQREEFTRRLEKLEGKKEEDANSDLLKRISALEEPKKWRDLTWKKISALMAAIVLFSGTISGLTKLISYLIDKVNF